MSSTVQLEIGYSTGNPLNYKYCAIYFLTIQNNQKLKIKKYIYLNKNNLWDRSIKKKLLVEKREFH